MLIVTDIFQSENIIYYDLSSSKGISSFKIAIPEDSIIERLKYGEEILIVINNIRRYKYGTRKKK